MQVDFGRLTKLPRRVLPIPDHADLRQGMPLLQTPSADLIRAERDGR